MYVLGIESSCDETGVALVDERRRPRRGCWRMRCTARSTMHQAYGGVVPELASRDHIRRVAAADAAGAGRRPACTLARGRRRRLHARARAGRRAAGRRRRAPARWPRRCGKPALGVHHLEGHLLSPFLSADPPEFPFVALLVSGGHTQLMRVDGVGRYALLGETIDDAAGEAFDKTRQAAGPGLSRRAGAGAAGRVRRPDGVQAAAADAAQRRPRFFLRRPEDRRADAGAQARRERCEAAHAPTSRLRRRRRSSTCW